MPPEDRGRLDEERPWIAARPDFLFPVRVLGALFRGKFLARLALLYKRGALRLDGPAAALADPARFGCVKDKLYRTRWVVYAKRPFGGPEQVFRYLGRYTHRVGLSNRRLAAIDDRGVTFRTRGEQTVTLAPDEFLRRFLLHVLPKGFVKIRHHGLMAPSNVTTRLAAARRLLDRDPRQLAGHQHISTTMKYMHLSPTNRGAAIALLDWAWETAGNGGGRGDILETQVNQPSNRKALG
jgi:hypothetical protein